MPLTQPYLRIILNTIRTNPSLFLLFARSLHLPFLVAQPKAGEKSCCF